jgi:hypothetical protein
MKKLQIALSLALVASTGCATIFAKKEVRVSAPTGATINGQSGTQTLAQQDTHLVVYADGSTCTIDTNIGWPWIVLDLFTTGPIGLIVDGVTGNWKHLDDNCSGVAAAE